MRNLTFSLLWLLVAMPRSGLARADANADARAHYERGTLAFDLQHYDEAAREYEAAFAAKPDPVLLFNLGQAYRMAGDNERALRAYKTYLSRVPDADNGPDVARRVAELQRVVDQEARAKQAPPAGTLAPRPMGQLPSAPTAPPSAALASMVTTTHRASRQPLYKKWWLWSAVGAAAAGLTVGLAVGLTRPGYPAFATTPTNGTFHW